MIDPPQPLEAQALLAVSEFLRGVERRAAVFAELQSGSAGHGDRALASAMLAFRRAATQGPIADWSLHFWRLLLATPQLRRPPRNARWTTPVAGLAALGNGLRAVLLLKLLAELDANQSAAALCLPLDIHADALQRALRASGPGDSNLSAIRQRPHALTPARLVALAKRRERVLRGHALASRARSTIGWRRPALSLGLAACVIAFVATYVFDRAGDEHRATPRALAPAAPPLETFDGDFALITHRDFEQLATPGDRAFLDDLGFYAWYAARMAPPMNVAQDAAAPGVSAASIDTSAGGARHGAR